MCGCVGGGEFKGIVSPGVGEQKISLLVLIVYPSLPVDFMKVGPNKWDYGDRILELICP